MCGVIVTGSLNIVDAHTVRFLQTLQEKYGHVTVAPTRAEFPSVINLEQLRYALGQLRCIDAVESSITAIPARVHIETFPLRSVEHMQAMLKSPVNDDVDQHESLTISEILRERPDPLVLLTGCFDLIHQGHFRLIEKAATYGQQPIVGVLTTRGIRKQSKNIKRDRPFWSTRDRLTVLNELRSSPKILLFNGPNSLELIHSLKPDIFIKDKRDYMRTIIKQESRLVEEEGGRMVWFEEKYYSGSTTSIASTILGNRC